MVTVYNSTPVAYIDPLFQSHIDSLKEQSRRIFISTLSGNDTTNPCDVTSQRKWQIPEANGWDLNLFSISDMNNAFDRATINEVYLRAQMKTDPVGDFDKAPAGEGRVSDCQVLKLQIDYMAVRERAFRLRHATSIRCKMHGATRRRGHSSWNATVNLTDLGAGTVPQADDVTGPIGGVFTTVIRHLLLLIKAGYNVGPVDIVRPATKITVQEDGSIIAS